MRACNRREDLISAADSEPGRERLRLAAGVLAARTVGDSGFVTEHFFSKSINAL